MDRIIAYCGLPPSPGELLGRFNLDPVLVAALLGAAVAHIAVARRDGRSVLAATGWGIAAAAFVSPLCALSVSLFSARVVQHMVLALVAAPLIALALPQPTARDGYRRLALLTGGFTLALWIWHLPVPYDATFRSDALYWAMHLTLFGSATLLWRYLLRPPEPLGLAALAAGTVASIQMGLLGAVLSLSSQPLFSAHLLTTDRWGFTRLADQQLGGLVMWVPGAFAFLWFGLRAASHFWAAAERGVVRG